MKKVKMAFSVPLIIVICLTLSLLAEGPDNFIKQNVPYLAKSTSTQVTRTMSNISNWGYWMYRSGQSAIQPNGSSGGIYPRGTAGAIFADGFVWGGKVGDEIRVGGVTYNIGTMPGWIKEDGTACDPEDPRVKIWRIRPDYETLTYDMVRRDAMEVNELTSQADVSDAMCQAIIDQYAEDWENWPAELGAPVYEDGTPGIANADQVVWFVCNDLDPTATAGLYGSDPIGLELQVTAWAYAQPGASLGQIVFKKYKFINRSGGTIKDFYVSQWCDPDLGNYGDDLVGCDTTLSMGYVYNGGDTDDDYASFGLAPAAIGYDFFQGPLLDGVAGEDRNKNGVDDAEDYAVFDLKVVGPGKINLPMTTFGWFAAGSEISDPTLQDYEGTLQWYNMLQGYVPTDDIANPTPWHVGNNPALPVTVYPLAGDPVTQTGDVDGTYELNLSPADRRMCLTSGPFDFPDGEVQEVVVAVVGGLGDTRFSSITAMKNTDIVAQTLYDGAFEGVPKAPKGPKVTTRAFEDNVVLEWGSDADAVAATEGVVIAGYAFEGYNVYQLPNPAASKDEAELIATYDLVNGIEVIEGKKFVAEYGQVVEVPVQFGADVGVKRSFIIEKDYLTGDPLYEGNTYYFAVTAYNYNPAPILIEDKSLESALIAAPTVIQEPLPGDALETAYGDVEELTHSAGTCDGGATVKVIDPYALTGHEYEVFFDQQHYYMDVDGKWKTTNYPDSVGKALGKTMDVSPSTISGVAYTTPIAGTRDLKLVLDLVSPDYNYAEGIKLIFSSEIVINSASSEDGIAALINESENTVLFGSEVADATDLTGAGVFHGGELITVNVNTPTLPLAVDYIIYDDGWATLFCSDTANAATCELYGITDAVVVNAEGTCIISEEAYAFKTVKHWNVRDLDPSVNAVVLADQTIVSDIDVDTGVEAGNDAAGIVDGFQVAISASYDAPLDYTAYTHTRPDGSTDKFSKARAVAWYNYDAHGKPFVILSYMDHGWSGGAGTAASIDAYGFGTTSVDLLQRDYELRFTGEYGDAVGNYHPIKDGTGSLAILYGARGYDIATHPEVNNPGDGSAFFMRIPFEVWDMEDPAGPRQISMLIYDRMGNPATDTDFYAFHPANRVYCEFLMVPYAEVIAGSAGDYLESGNLTWNTVWWNCDWTTGDVLSFQYDNPIQLGVDKFTFSTTAPTLANTELAKDAVKKVNVFPNPYYAYNALSTNRFDNYVTFTHLPAKATIRIFTLAGIQVRVLEKDSPSAQFLRWDLLNESDLPVASGIYIAYIDIPDLNKTKVLKFVIIQNKQILEYY